MMPLSAKISIFLFTCAVVYVVSFGLPDSGIGKTKVLRLLDGDMSVEIERFEIEYQQRRVVCDDPEVLAELAEAFRHATRNPKAGATYSLMLHFRRGGKFITTFYVWDGELSVSVSPYEEHPPTHRLVFPNPSGAKMTQLITFLQQPWQSVANTQLVFHKGETPKLEKIGR